MRRRSQKTSGATGWSYSVAQRMCRSGISSHRSSTGHVIDLTSFAKGRRPPGGGAVSQIVYTVRYGTCPSHGPPHHPAGPGAQLPSLTDAMVATIAARLQRTRVGGPCQPIPQEMGTAVSRSTRYLSGSSGTQVGRPQARPRLRLFAQPSGAIRPSTVPQGQGAGGRNQSDGSTGSGLPGHTYTSRPHARHAPKASRQDGRRLQAHGRISPDSLRMVRIAERRRAALPRTHGPRVDPMASTKSLSYAIRCKEILLPDRNSGLKQADLPIPSPVHKPVVSIRRLNHGCGRGLACGSSPDNCHIGPNVCSIRYPNVSLLRRDPPPSTNADIGIHLPDVPCVHSTLSRCVDKLRQNGLCDTSPEKNISGDQLLNKSVDRSTESGPTQDHSDSSCQYSQRSTQGSPSVGEKFAPVSGSDPFYHPHPPASGSQDHQTEHYHDTSWPESRTLPPGILNDSSSTATTIRSRRVALLGRLARLRRMAVSRAWHKRRKGASSRHRRRRVGGSRSRSIAKPHWVSTEGVLSSRGTKGTSQLPRSSSTVIGYESVIGRAMVAGGDVARSTRPAVSLRQQDSGSGCEQATNTFVEDCSADVSVDSGDASAVLESKSGTCRQDDHGYGIHGGPGRPKKVRLVGKGNTTPDVPSGGTNLGHSSQCSANRYVLHQRSQTIEQVGIGPHREITRGVVDRRAEPDSQMEPHESSATQEVHPIFESTAEVVGGNIETAESGQLHLSFAGHPLHIPLVDAGYLKDAGCPTVFLCGRQLRLNSAGGLATCERVAFPSEDIPCDDFISMCMRARGWTQESVTTTLEGRYLKSGASAIRRYNPTWTRWVNFLKSEGLHPFCFPASTLSNFLIHISRTVSPGAAGPASSAVTVIYAQALGLHIKTPSTPIEGRDEVNLRKALAAKRPAIRKPLMGFDLALVRQYLVEQGPLLECVSLDQLVPRILLLARAFYGFRAADLACMAHTVVHPVDAFDNGNHDHLSVIYRIPFFMTKTAPKTKVATAYWSFIPVQPLSQRRMKEGLRLSARAARQIAEACCFIRGIHKLRQLMLPKLKRCHKVCKLTTESIYSEGFFPYLKSSLRKDNQTSFNFLKSTTINGIIFDIHVKIINPDEDRKFIANWYRHNALSCMEAVGCEDDIRVFSEHTSTKTFSKSYRITISDLFRERLDRCHSLSAFSFLTAQERLQL